MVDVFIILTTKGVHFWSRLCFKEEREQLDLIYVVVWALRTRCSDNGTRSLEVLRFKRVCALGGWYPRRLRASSLVAETRCTRSPDICCGKSRGAPTRSRMDLTWRIVFTKSLANGVVSLVEQRALGVRENGYESFENGMKFGIL